MVQAATQIEAANISYNASHNSNSVVRMLLRTIGLDLVIPSNTVFGDLPGVQTVLDFARNLTGSDKNDTIQGWHQNDYLDGGIGNDLLRGDSGNDSLHGGAGNDTLHGGVGDDYLYVDSGTDVFYGGAGADKFYGVAGSSATIMDADVSDRIYVDYWWAKGIGYTGLATYSADAGGAAGYPGWTINLGGKVFAIIQYNNGTLTIPESKSAPSFSIPNFVNGQLGIYLNTGTAGNDTTIGTTANDSISGADGNDTLDGSIGNDTLMGGTGNDKLIGGTGSDYIDGGLGTDTLSFETSSTWVSANLATNSFWNGDATWDNVTNVEILTGSASSDYLYGNMGANVLDGSAGNDSLSGADENDTLIGGNGNDKIIGGLGSDYVDGGVGIDTFSFETSSTWVSANLGSNNFWNGDATWDNVTNVENLTGSSFNDYLYGNASSNTLLGGNGNDTIQGQGGSDVLTGGAGSDTFTFTLISNSSKTTADRITDFTLGQDKIDIHGLGFTGLVAGTATGTLLSFSYDSVANKTIISATADFKIVLDGNIALTSSHFIY